MTPPRPRTLTRQAVIDAALAIVDRHGADKLTMRALGRELGVDPMAAYNHVPNKSAVLDGVVEAVWADLRLPEDSDAPWPDQLRAVAGAVRDVLRRHPNALPILATHANRSVPGHRLVDRALGPLLAAGLDPARAVAFVNAAGSFIIGHTLAEMAPTSSSGEADLEAAMATSAADGGLPNLAQVMDAVTMADLSWDDIFDTGIDALIAGIDQALDEEARR